MNMKKAFETVVGITGIGIGLLVYILDHYPEAYSEKWFDSLSDEKLKTQREKVRQAWCSAGDDFAEGVRLQKLLRRFDDIMRKREKSGGAEYVWPKHGEHGWYLSGDD